MARRKHIRRWEAVEIDAYTYTREDFDTPAPYEHIEKIQDPFQKEIEERRLAEYAAETCKFKAFRKTLKQYRESRKQVTASLIPEANVSDITGQDFEFDTGDWIVDDYGVRKRFESEIACPHPIWPVERLKNIDTGEIKVRLAFRRGSGGRRMFQTILTDFDTVANAKNIVSLARVGISVTSGKRAQNLADYITDILDLNYDRIPETRSVSRMGWNDEGFAPYVDGVVFDGNANFADTFAAICPRGDYDAWKAEARACRKASPAARLVLDASFASPLVGPLGCLPFFVHLWGMDSGTGKSVAQMLAASVWADPVIGGRYYKTFKATSTGFEIVAGFLNSLPVIIDELQLARDNRGKVNFNVYELAAGSGKLRSNKALGLVTAPTWANCFITSGETPLVGENDGAGAMNRVVDIECRAEQKVIQDGHHTAGILKANYGHAGREFVRLLSEPGGMDSAKILYEAYYEKCLDNDTTEKQAMAAALLLTADALAAYMIFGENSALQPEDIQEYLKSKESVSAAARGYNYMCDWVSQNAERLEGKPISGQVYGIIEDDGMDSWAYIIRSVWVDACNAASINSPALLSHLRSRDLIKTRGRAMTVNKRINRIATECVALRLPRATFEDLPDGDFPE